jgi:lipopolysaccharide export system protein LptA
LTRILHAALVTALLSLPAGLASAQGAQVAFGGLKQDPTLPVEVAADQLSVDQAQGTAVFQGNVDVRQGDLRLTAGRLQVEYAEGGGAIVRLHATDGVTIVNAADAAQGREAIYTIATGEVVLTGDVVLTQGKNAMSGQKLTLDLKAGTGVMEGRVQTVFTPAQD